MGKIGKQSIKSLHKWEKDRGSLRKSQSGKEMGSELVKMFESSDKSVTGLTVSLDRFLFAQVCPTP
jgi:hypothetical protein